MLKRNINIGNAMVWVKTEEAMSLSVREFRKHAVNKK